MVRRSPQELVTIRLRNGALSAFRKADRRVKPANALGVFRYRATHHLHAFRMNEVFASNGFNALVNRAAKVSKSPYFKTATQLRKVAVRKPS